MRNIKALRIFFFALCGIIFLSLPLHAANAQVADSTKDKRDLRKDKREKYFDKKDLKKDVTDRNKTKTAS